MDALAIFWGVCAGIVWSITLVTMQRNPSGACALAVQGFFLGLLGPLGIVAIIIYLVALGNMENSNKDIPTESGQQKMQ